MAERAIGQIRKAGQKVMADSSVVICGLVRDCENNLRSIVPQVERLGNAFKSYRVIVVENDSNDGSGELVSSWQEANQQVKAIRFSYVGPENPAGKGWFGENRIDRMTFARNLYLELIEQQALADFVTVIDLDVRSFELMGIEKSFGLLDEWDVITANGSRYSRRHPLRRSVYWDSYAFEPLSGFDHGVQTARQIRNSQYQVSDALKSNPLVRARSAFGGLGIYRGELLEGHRYCTLKNDDPAIPVLSEHHGLHRSIREQNIDLRLMIHSELQVNYGSLAHLTQYTLRNLFSS
jgi:hypothetical protein